jgi:DNA-binding NarL/FixJ family response regulator
MMRLLIVDDHALFRQGLRSLLETINYIDIVGEAEDGYSILEMADSLKPDLVLMDIAMPGCDGLEATRQLKARYPKIKVLIISMHADYPFVRQALKVGASGYIFKGAPFLELKAALDSIIRDVPYVSPALLGPILDDYKTLIPDDEINEKHKKLTLREKEILELLIQGLGRREIAERLFISPKTVDRHKGNLKEKLNINSDLEMQDIARLLNRL